MNFGMDTSIGTGAGFARDIDLGCGILPHSNRGQARAIALFRKAGDAQRKPGIDLARDRRSIENSSSHDQREQ